jgi:hypothetical protein
MRRPKLLEGDEDVLVQKGMHVLVSNLYYRFWVHVAEIQKEKQKIIGIICSRISKSCSYQFGDVIQFRSQNILAAFTESSNQTDANIQRNHQA